MLPHAGASECSACPAGTSKGAGEGPCEPCDDGDYAPVDGSSSCRTCSWPLATLKNSSSTSCDACVENYYWSAADDAVCTEEQCPEFCSACLGPCWNQTRSRRRWPALRWLGSKIIRPGRIDAAASKWIIRGRSTIFISKNQPKHAHRRGRPRLFGPRPHRRVPEARGRLLARVDGVGHGLRVPLQRQLRRRRWR